MQTCQLASEFSDEKHLIDDIYPMQFESIHLVGSARMKEWHSQPALELASQADCKRFTAALPCQQAVEQLWSGNVRCNFLLYLLTMLCPFLILAGSRWYQFDIGVAFALDERTDTSEAPAPRTFWEKVKRFYSCPRTKFTWNIVRERREQTLMETEAIRPRASVVFVVLLHSPPCEGENNQPDEHTYCIEEDHVASEVLQGELTTGVHNR